jgi:hypothetical protein
MINAIRLETTIQTNGELHLKNLPCRRGDRVEAIVLILQRDGESEGAEGDQAAQRAQDEARRRFLQLARESTFCSTSPYPTRDELHERH